MRPSEKAALGMALDALEKPKARERQAEAGKANLPGSASHGKVPPLAKGPVRDIVGQAIGMSGKTYERAKRVVQAAEDESLPPETRAVAREALDVSRSPAREGEVPSGG